MTATATLEAEPQLADGDGFPPYRRTPGVAAVPDQEPPMSVVVDLRLYEVVAAAMAVTLAILMAGIAVAYGLGWRP